MVTPDLLRLSQMRQRSFGVSRCIALFAFINCLFEMFDSSSVWIGLGLLTGLCVGQRSLGVCNESEAHLAMVNGLLGMRDGFGDMISRSQH
jgi:hypothetical protein